MTIILYIALAVSLLGLVVVFWKQVSTKHDPLKKREFRYLKWVIYLLNVLIIGLGLNLVLGLTGTVLHHLGLSDSLQNFIFQTSQEQMTFLLDNAEQSIFSKIIDMVNMITVLGIFFCMRAFMKNIISEDIFIPENVRWARLSTVFLALGSLIRPGIDTSSLVTHGNYGEQSYEYSFFSLNYLLVAVLVWTLSIVLEKAIAIAKENEFTI